MQDWDSLRYFLAVAEAGSLSAAARRLRVSQPTVGRRIAALEAEMRTRLFDRAGRRLRATAAADGLLEAARRMAQEADDAARRFAGRDRELSGPVRLSCTEGLGARWLPHALRSLRDELPGVDLELVVDNFAVNLSRGEADLALRLRDSTRRDERQDLVGRRLGRLAFGLYAAPDYLARRGAPTTLAELSRHDLIAPPETMRVADHFDWWAERASGTRVAFRSNSLIAQLEAARAGWGVALMARIHGEGQPDLVRVLPTLAPQGPELWILYHADLRRNARVRAVAERVADLTRRAPFLLEQGEGRRSAKAAGAREV
jgi:DNA-binding transcriptional LysR family regulator